MAVFQDGLLTFTLIRGSSSSKWRVSFFYLSLFCLSRTANSDSTMGGDTAHIYTAIVNITYKDPATGEQTTEKHQMGRYGTINGNEPRMEKGWIVHVRSDDNSHHGCKPIINVPKSGEKWIALIKRGECRFQQKIKNAIDKNASAVVVYNNQIENDLITMEHKVGDHVVAIFISLTDGQRIAKLVDNGTKVYMLIAKGQHLTGNFNHINKTSVLFVSISFIVLMIISLAWLVFYYIQRFRYAHAKERLSKRLMNAAKKAIGKMPMRTLKSGDKETESEYDQCAICIESYKSSDVIRVLPCKHVFHKSCVDPWLIEQRSCPMCKLDILKAYGLQMHASRESMANIELDVGSSSLARIDLGHDPLGFSDAPPTPHLETIRYQPATVEHHQHPGPSSGGGQAQLSSSSETSPKQPREETVDLCIVHKSCKDKKKIGNAPSDSLESVRSTDSDTTNELQSLMPRSSAKDKIVQPPSKDTTKTDDVILVTTQKVTSS